MLAILMVVLCQVRLFTDATESAIEFATESGTELGTESTTSSVGFWIEFNRTITQPTQSPLCQLSVKKCPVFLFSEATCCPEELICCGTLCCKDASWWEREQQCKQSNCYKSV